jgi:aspartyl protease family protein
MNILNYSMSIETGNGPIRAAPVTLDSLTIGAITERSVSALVAQPPLNVNMLGMSFLNRLESYEGRGDRFIMRGRP